MKEVWNTIEGFEGYEVSSIGRVKSYKSNRSGGKILCPIKVRRGYLVVNLMCNGKMSQHLIHRIVAKAFIPNPHNKPQVNHKNFNKEDNTVDNLEWVSSRENLVHYCMHKESSTDSIGVTKRGNTFIAQISIESCHYNLGSYKTLKKAEAAYNKAISVYNKNGLKAFLNYKNRLYLKYNHTSEYMNVSYDKSRGMWKASVHKGSTILNRRFKTEEEAVEAVIECYTHIGRTLHHSHKMYIEQKLQVS